MISIAFINELEKTGPRILSLLYFKEEIMWLPSLKQR